MHGVLSRFKVISIVKPYQAHFGNVTFLSKGHGEFLLVFQTLAIYVDLQGRKSRDREIMYPAVPTHISTITLLFFVC